MIVSNDQMRTMDQIASTVYGIPSIVLMENTGRNSAEAVLAVCRQENRQTAIIVCGKGNNGGDGFVVARYLQNAGIKVTIYLLADPKNIHGDARTNLEVCIKSNLSIVHVEKATDIQIPIGSILVDALLGTGIRGEISGLYADVITHINSSKETKIISIDMPSGINGDDAMIGHTAVYADYTLTMAAAKQAQLFYPAREHIGVLQVIDIGFPDVMNKDPDHQLFSVNKEDIVLSSRDKRTHKHTAGKVLIIGASPGFSGAVCLAARGASLAGAGLVVVAIPQSLNGIIENKLTEQMSLPLPDAGNGLLSEQAVNVIVERLNWADVILIGPGMGRNSRSLKACGLIIDQVLKLNKKLLIDADGLYWLSQNPGYLSKLNSETILTPHQGEFSRIFPNEKNNLAGKPWLALENALQQTQATINLKGPVSITGSKVDGRFINTTGNPGLAKGGSGDLLGGMISGFMATGMAGYKAAYTANFIHGDGADRAAAVYGLQSYSMEDLLEMMKKSFVDISYKKEQHA